MPREKPTMIAGMKAPMSVRLEKAAKDGPERFGPVVPDKEGSVVYESRYRRLRVQITSPAEIYDPATGIKTRQKPVVAQFDEGFFVNEPRLRDGDPNPFFEITEKRLRANSAFRVDFWLKSEMDEKARNAALDNAKKQLQEAPPEVMEAFVKDLAASGKLDHVLPQRQPVSVE